MISKVLNALTRNEKSIRRLLILILLYLIPGVAAMGPILDPDIWWHLRTGQWIVEHGAVPTTDPFSIYGMERPWIAYSWLFELLVYGLHRAFGLVGIVFYTTFLSLIIAVALHALVRRIEPRFSISVAITALGLGAMVPLMSPRPWLFSILFFIIELDILISVRRSGNPRLLLFLPPLFVFWANIHIQFIYGLFVLGLATAEPIIDRLFHRHPPPGDDAKALPFAQLLLFTVACAIATLATPYHLHIYRTIFELIQQTGPFQYINELQPLLFRGPSDWFVLAATLGAAFLLGWRREIRLFPLLLLATGIFLSFRARRDAWFVVVAAVAIIPPSLPIKVAVDRFPLTKLRTMLVTGGVLIALVIVGRIRDISEPHLQSAVVKKYPVAAAAVVERYGYPGPLYNHFNWGGYLIWRLPKLPVAMDGRGNLHGDKRIERSLKTWAGKRDWASDPELSGAHLVIANVNHALASLLRLYPPFKIVYEDDVATVFVARPQDRGPN